MANEYVCDNCGDTFERYPSQVTGENKFCEKPCMYEYQEGKSPWKKYPDLDDEEWLRQKHYEEGLSYEEIADELGCSPQNVSKRARQHGMNPNRAKNPELDDVKWLREKHHNENLSLSEIANRVGCTRSAVGYAMRRNDIEIRQNSVVHEVDGGLSWDDREIIKGELLGDGCIPKPHGKAGAMFSYGTAKKGYRDWLADCFEEIGMDTTRNEYSQGDDRDGWSETMTYRFSTRVYFSLMDMRKRWYPDGEKIIPEGFELSPLSLRHLHIGDGNYHKEGGTITLYTDGFDDESVQRLQKELLEKAGVDARVTHRNSLAFGASKDRRKFFDYMAPLPEELDSVYGYKWP